MTRSGALVGRTRSLLARIRVHRFGICAVSLLLVLLAGAGISRLTLSGDYEVYFDHSDPRLEELNRLHAVFSRNDNMLFAVIPADGTVFTPRTLEAVRALTERAWRLPFSVRVDSITNYQDIRSSGDEVVIEALLPGDVPRSAREIGRFADAVMGAKALRNRLINVDGSATGVSVQLELTGNRRLNVLEAARAGRELAREFERAHPGLDVRLSGNAMLNAAFPEASISDLKFLTPIMYLSIFVLLGVLLRSVRAALFSTVVVVAASAAAMGIAGWLGMSITSASVVAPSIITTVAVADSMHLLTGVQRFRAAGFELSDAILRALEVNLRPIVVTSLTTAIGFLSLNFSDAPPFRDLGNITAIGVVAALALSVVSLPALMLCAGWGSGLARAPVLDLGGLSRWVIRRRGTLFATVFVVSALCAAVIPRMELNDAFVEYFDERIEFRRDTDLIMQRLTGIYQLEYAVHADGDFGIHDPAYLRTLEQFVSWLEMQPEVMHVTSVVDVLKRLNQKVGNAGYMLPDSREAVGQYLLLYGSSVPYGLDLNSRLSVDRDASRVTATLRNLDNVALRALETRAASWLSANAPAHMRAPATGAAVMFAYIAQRNILSMLRGGAVAVVVIALVLGIVFKGWRLGLLSLIPNTVPAVIAFGVWTMAVGEIGIALAVVAAMTLGVVVDDTVHFTTHFLDGLRRMRLSAEDAVQHAFVTAGPALVATTMVLVIGFSVLGLSAYQVNHGMGQLTALVIACALLADFAMLPWLLVHAARRDWL